MPTVRDGQLNLSSINVPGVYIDIIPPQPTLLGSPTNFEAFVGGAQWGPVNAPTFFSTPDNCAGIFGTPSIRKYDLPSYVWAAATQGGAIGFVGVRVTDGTDVAATVPVQSAALAAAGSIAFTVNPSASQTLTLNGTAVTFVASGATGNQVNIGVSLSATLTALLAFLQASADTQIVKFSAALSGNSLNLTAVTGGVTGNSLTIATTVTGATASGATLSGGAASTTGVTLTSKYTGSLGSGITATLQNGSAANSYRVIVNFPNRQPEIFDNITGTGNAFWQNVANAINNGTAFVGPSHFLIATAGASTASPAVGTTYSLSGGTDGVSGLTDAMLIGNDVRPRSGMYALRQTNIDAFTLCDLSTSSMWPTMDAFGFSESCLAVFSTVSGDTYTDAISTLISVGLDDWEAWAIVGDFPTFYDTQNQVSRLINPSAIALGLLGNLSPQFSPLNQQLFGVSATQTTQANSAYADADISLIESGRVDVIVGPPTTPGGNYYTFISGRNASSNTSANGIEYTRLTNFIARSLQSKAAGSIVGKLQSLRANDSTRADAKALIDGYMASIADPQSGTEGNGMIDQWSTQCDLTNNPQYLQQRGFLFAYVAVRYLNTVRYFVIKLAGGGNVTVTSQSTPPSPAQFA